MIVEIGKHKGMPLSQLSMSELQAMAKEMTAFYQKLTNQISAVNREIHKRQKGSVPQSVRDARFKLGDVD